MNREHFRAFVWLRWRLRANQFRKAGSLNFVFYVIMLVCAAIAAVGLAIAGFFVGWLALPLAPAPVRLFVWDGVVLAFLFFWSIGLLTDLQRTESLALDKCLHLPVSLSSAFLINYLSSLFSLTLAVFVPGMIGLLLGQAIAHGPALLLGIPLLLGFVLLVTAVTYQFQGWLATLMANPRRRRTIIVLFTGCFILVAQLPNLINLMRPKHVSAPYEAESADRAELNKRAAETKMPPSKLQEEIKALEEKHKQLREERDRQEMEEAGNIAWWISAGFPPGWLAVGSAGLPEGRLLPSLLGTLGFAAIGMFSLWRSYRTTLRLYTGYYSASEKTVENAESPILPDGRTRLVERQVPYVSEQASAVCMAAFRSMTRAPEAKMALLAPLIMGMVFLGIAMSNDSTPLQAVRPILVFGVASAVLILSGVQLIGNQFGYDRTGFRAYVLSPIPRHEILLGKNLAAAPLVLAQALFGLILVGAVFPLRIDHYPAALVQIATAYLLFCLLANPLSMVAPLAMAPGSMQASNVKLVPVLLQMVFLMFFPFALIPAALPIGLEALLEQTEVVPRGVPISLLLSLPVFAGALWLYRRIIREEGTWLLAREQKILDVVTSKSD